MIAIHVDSTTFFCHSRKCIVIAFKSNPYHFQNRQIIRIIPRYIIYIYSNSKNRQAQQHTSHTVYKPPKKKKKEQLEPRNREREKKTESHAHHRAYKEERKRERENEKSEGGREEALWYIEEGEAGLARALVNKTTEDRVASASQAETAPRQASRRSPCLRLRCFVLFFISLILTALSFVYRHFSPKRKV